MLTNFPTHKLVKKGRHFFHMLVIIFFHRRSATMAKQCIDGIFLIAGTTSFCCLQRCPALMTKARLRKQLCKAFFAVHS